MSEEKTQEIERAENSTLEKETLSEKDLLNFDLFFEELDEAETDSIFEAITSELGSESDKNEGAPQREPVPEAEQDSAADEQKVDPDDRMSIDYKFSFSVDEQKKRAFRNERKNHQRNSIKMDDYPAIARQKKQPCITKPKDTNKPDAHRKTSGSLSMIRERGTFGSLPVKLEEKNLPHVNKPKGLTRCKAHHRTSDRMPVRLQQKKSAFTPEAAYTSSQRQQPVRTKGTLSLSSLSIKEEPEKAAFKPGKKRTISLSNTVSEQHSQQLIKTSRPKDRIKMDSFMKLSMDDDFNNKYFFNDSHAMSMEKEGSSWKRDRSMWSLKDKMNGR